MITIYTGIPGAGKSLKTAQKAIDLLNRNVKWFKRTGIIRPIYSNIRFSEPVEKEFFHYIKYWSEPDELVKIRDADVIWDEIATHLDSTQWQNVPLELKRWLQQHRKFGIDIYGNTQDFAMVDISMRRLTGELYYMTKLIGSRDKSATTPEVKYIWGLIIVKELNPQEYKEDSKLNKSSGLPRFIWISRDLVSVFDTTQEISGKSYPALRHIERFCEVCQHKKVIHA